MTIVYVSSIPHSSQKNHNYYRIDCININEDYRYWEIHGVNMMEVVLKIRMPDNWVKDIGKKFLTPIKFLECMPTEILGGVGLSR